MTDWLPELDDDDIDTIAEALEAWESNEAGEMWTWIGTIESIPPNIRMRVNALASKERDMARIRKERSVTLRAKLIQLRNRRRVEKKQGGLDA
jgi:hypothetical protein